MDERQWCEAQPNAEREEGREGGRDGLTTTLRWRRTNGRDDIVPDEELEQVFGDEGMSFEAWSNVGLGNTFDNGVQVFERGQWNRRRLVRSTEDGSP